MGICHATERALPVSRPTDKLDRIPGPRVAEMKSGFRLTDPSARLIVACPSLVVFGRLFMALLTRCARLC